jgi:2-polyprenyl-6-methoxyphenol hydroxylase-like FAD-dependent oxidoreductase
VHEINPAQEPANQATPDAPYRGVFWIGQTNVEALLRERLASQGVQVELNCQLTELTQDDHHVVANVARAGNRETILARYIVGCDGGHSTVRQSGDFAFMGETMESEHYLNGGLKISELDPAYAHHWFHPTKGLLALTPLRYERIWVFQAGISADENDMSLGTFQRIFDERAALPGIRLSDLNWYSIWRTNVRMVDHYRNGRVLLAGDAAHVHSAVGGQGMNTGIGDAYNLSWKLAHVLRGAPDALLDSYQAERVPIAKAVLAFTTARHRALLHPERRRQRPHGRACVRRLSFEQGSHRGHFSADHHLPCGATGSRSGRRNGHPRGGSGSRCALHVCR